MKRELYPDDWEAISLRIRERAGWRCEWCGVEYGQPNPITGSTVVLSVAHLDHDPSNCADDNLRALCQRCAGTPLQHLTGEQAFRRISVAVRPVAGPISAF